MNRKRSNRVSVYFTDEELEILYDRYSINPENHQRPNVRLVRYIRDLALDGELKDAKINPIALEQYKELARLSSNLNQLSHLNNQNKRLDLSQLKSLLMDLRSNLMNIEVSHES